MKKSLRAPRVISLLVVLSAAVSNAQVVVRDTSFLLRPIVVSATKTPAPDANLSQAVTVLYGDDLRARGVTRVTDALREVPGAALVQSGSFGSVTSLFLRGGESRYTKVLIDGVAVNAAGGFFDLSHLTTDNIDRIEVVRGPASVVYGADAVSGVIQIFTRTGDAGVDRFDHSASIRAGTFGSRDADASIEHGGIRTAFTLGGGLHSSDGIVPFNNRYKNGTLSGSVRGSRTHLGEARISSRYTAADYHYPQDYSSAPVDSNAHRVQHRLTVAGEWLRYLSNTAALRVLVGSNDVSDLTEDVSIPFGATARSHSLSLSRGFRRTAEGRVLYQLPLSATVTSGVEYLLDKERSGNRAGAVGATPTPTDGFVAARHNVAYYTELLGTAPGRLSYNVSGRIDDNSDYGTIPSYRLGTSIPVIGRFRLRASLATAFNAPAFNQLRATTYTVASPNLQPERSRSWEVGFEQTWPAWRLHLSGAYFNQRFSQLIQYVDGGPPSFLGSYANLTAASSNGYEGEAIVLLPAAFRISGSFSVVAPKVTSVSQSYSGSLRPGDALIRRPTHSATLRVGHSMEHETHIDLSGSYVGKRPDLDFAQFPSPTLTLPSYIRVDASAERPIVTLPNFDRVSLTVRVENVFGKKYQDVIGYPAPGRVVLIGAALRSPNSR